MNFFSFSFPTLYFAPAGQKTKPKKYEVNIVRMMYSFSSAPTLLFEIICSNVTHSNFMFQGGREVSDFISYLKREATNPLVVQEESKKKKKKKDGKVEL